MAEIDVKIKGDDADFKRKLEESALATKEFASFAKEQMLAFKETAADVMGESGFGLVGKGITGGQVAIVAFGAAIAEAFKKAVEGATEFEKQSKSLGFALGIARAGMSDDLMKWTESVSGAMGGIDEDVKTFHGLIGVGMGVEQAKNQLIDIQNVAAKTGSSVEEVGNAIVQMRSRGEIPKGFFRENTQIAALVKQMLGPEIPKPGEPVPSAEGADEKLMTRVTAKGGADWFLRSVFPMIAPGGMAAGIRSEVESTAAGKWADVQVQFAELAEEVGHELLPSVKDFANELKKDLPEITETLKGFAAGLEQAFEALGKVAKPVGGVLGTIFQGPSAAELQEMRTRPTDISWMKPVWDEMVREFQDATRAHADNAGYMNRALRPQQ
jgi:hypothetical protein